MSRTNGFSIATSWNGSRRNICKSCQLKRCCRRCEAELQRKQCGRKNGPRAKVTRGFQRRWTCCAAAIGACCRTLRRGRGRSLAMIFRLRSRRHHEILERRKNAAFAGEIGRSACRATRNGITTPAIMLYAQSSRRGQRQSRHVDQRHARSHRRPSRSAAAVRHHGGARPGARGDPPACFRGVALIPICTMGRERRDVRGPQEVKKVHQVFP